MSATQAREHCVHCGAPPHHRASPYCKRCDDLVYKAQAKVTREVRKAERLGLIPKAKSLVCVDCGKPAFDYDHRDYSKPLVMDPVCRRCNQLRGPATASPFLAAPAMTGGMTYADLIKHFGSQGAVARALGLSQPSVFGWKSSGVPPLRQIQIEAVTSQKLVADADVYEKQSKRGRVA